MSAPKDTPALAPPVPRTIPGFTQPAASSQPKPRKRSSKKSTTTVGSEPANALALGTGTVTPVREEASSSVTLDDAADESLIKRTNAVEQTKKRLRAQNKKLQRLDAYEAKADINDDQRRALAGRGTIDAVVKELNELLVILQAEEVEDVEREKRVIAAEAKKHAQAVEAAVEASKTQAQSRLVLLFQFLRLRSLFAPNQPSSFAPPVLPPAVASATGQEVAAVHTLFDEFSNGPLLGGNGDALEKLEKIATGSQDAVIEGVTFARVLELVHGLTAPPPAPASEQLNGDKNNTRLESPVVVESLSAPGPSDSVVALVDGEKEETHPAPSFLNESEIEPASPPADRVASWQDDVQDQPQVAPSDPATPTADILSFTTSQSTPPALASSTAQIPSPVAQALGAGGGGGGNAFTAAAAANDDDALSAVTPPAIIGEQEPKLDWSTEEAGAALPDLPELSQPGPSPNAAANANANNNNNNNNNAGTNGQNQNSRGSRRGGGYRGGPGEGVGPDGQQQQSRRGSWRGRGGRGGGGGRGGNGARGGRGRGKFPFLLLLSPVS
ncbi:hypothetical protein JCM3766R1_001680 [Sporobolomyces carnicolor]